MFCMRQLNKSIACMIRGKSIEEAIRFSFLDHKEKFSVPASQNYANDLYYLRTKHLSPSVVKFNAKPINAIVKAGINLFSKMGIKSLKKIESYYFNKNNNNIYIFPDFVPHKLFIENRKLRNSCLELKVSGDRKRRISKKHVYQCSRYSTKSRKPVILLYLFFSKKPKKNGIYDVFPRIYIISNKRMRKFKI